MSIDHASAAKERLASPLNPPLGGTEFLSRAQRSQRCRELAESGYLVARVVPPFDRDGEDAGLCRGGLREALEGAVEISLALRGALPPAVALGAPVEASARDQVYRVQKLGSRGLCVVMPDLRRLTEQTTPLDAADSAALEAWRCMAVEGPVTLLFDETDKDLVMLAPRRLDEVFKVTRRLPSSWPDDARSLLDATPAEPAEKATEIDAGWEGPEAAESSFYEAPTRPGLAEPPRAMPSSPPPGKLGTSNGNRVMASDPLMGLDIDETAEPSDALGKGSGRPLQVSLFEHVAALEGSKPSSHRPSSHREAIRLSRDTVERFCEQLQDAHGPRPVSAVEDLFRTRYTPLLEALSAGLHDERAERVVEDWRAAFEKSYGESFNTMRVTGKRPKMVLDAPDLAAKIAKSHGARAVQLLLVDGMRYDLGQRVQRELAQWLEGRAECVDDSIMWSALPTITPVQLHLLARGPRGLREEPHSEREPGIHRAGSLTTLRRVRIGQRDLLKLDLAEARLREAGPGFESRMSALAEEISDVVGHLADSLPARTLLYVFGDHGFYLPIGGPDATGPAEQGNATPEEVLVGAQAWLIGDRGPAAT